MLNPEPSNEDSGWASAIFPPPDSVVFEWIDGELRQSTPSPEWIDRLKAAAGSAVSITDSLPFLESFLPEATLFWDQESDGQVVSDFWTQVDATGEQIHLLAYALSLDGLRLLLIRTAEGLYRESERVQQKAHASVDQLKLAALWQRGLQKMASSQGGSDTKPGGPEAKDALTGIYSRRHFDETLERELQSANEKHEALSIVFLDIDHLQLINDQYGRTAGDVYLRSVAQLIACLLSRPRDIAARVGGEEFAVLLPGTGGTEAVRLAHTFSGMIRDLKIPNPFAGGLLNATASIGVFTRAVRSEETAARILEVVQSALGEAKRRGGNRVVIGD